jgi:hypothetical protein
MKRNMRVQKEKAGKLWIIFEMTFLNSNLDFDPKTKREKQKAQSKSIIG